MINLLFQTDRLRGRRIPIYTANAVKVVSLSLIGRYEANVNIQVAEALLEPASSIDGKTTPLADTQHHRVGIPHERASKAACELGILYTPALISGSIELVINCLKGKKYY